MEWPEPVQRVAAVLETAEIEARIEEFRGGTHSAEAAAEAVGCKLRQIVKTVVIVVHGGATAVALVPGDRRADVEKVARAAGVTSARVAAADEVRTLTGFEPGAVAPFPLPQVRHVFADRALVTEPELWIGAGSTSHLAVLKPADLLRVARATPMDVAERPG